jgi:ubiquinone/menaquinone biosynthesis C-methylase UbiE
LSQANAKHSRWRPLSLSERVSEPELMDGADLDWSELDANFRDIRRVNRLLGGVATVLSHLPPMLSSIPSDQPITILDLATGSADIPLAVVNWAKQNGRNVDVVASDYSDDMLAIARRHLKDTPEITLARYDARAVSLPDKQFDIVLCSLSLHHFEPEDAASVLKEMDRLARRGFIVNDLRRSRFGFVAAWLAARATTRNRLTRNDAPLSVRRAYTPEELVALLDRAGIEGATITTHPWFRMAAVKVKAAGDA